MPDVRAASRYRSVSTVMATIALAAAIVALWAALHVSASQRAACERGNFVRAQLVKLWKFDRDVVAPSARMAADPELRQALSMALPDLYAALASEDLRQRDC